MPKPFLPAQLFLCLAFALCCLLLPRTAAAAELPPSPGDDIAGWKTEAVNQSFSAMDFSAPNDGWAIAHRYFGADRQASLYHYDGRRWRWTQSFDNMTLWDVSALSPTDAWLLGHTRDDDGYDISHLYHYDGEAWQPFSEPADVLYGIEMLSAQEGYISGEESLWRYDGATWTAIAASPPNAGLTRERNEFQALDGQNLWVRDVSSYIGPPPTGTRGPSVYKFDGTAWQPSLLEVQITSLAIVSPTLGWAGSGGGAILRYDGVTWQTFTPVPNPYDESVIYSVEAVAGVAGRPQEAWAVIPEGIYHYDGSAWGRQLSPPRSSLLVLFDANTGWLGPATRYTGGVWRYSLNLIEPIDFPNLYSGAMPGVFVRNSNSVWYSNHVLEGGIWRTIPFRIEDDLIAPFVGQPGDYVKRTGLMSKIQMVDAANGWAIGDISLETADGSETQLSNFLFHYSGGEWVASATPDSIGSEGYATLDEFAVTGGDTLWLLGANSAIYRYKDGQWQTVRPPREPDSATPYLSALAMLSSMEGWAAGDAFLHYDGQEWTVTQPISDSIRALAMVSSDDGWAVGDRGAIYHYNGQNWQKAPSPTTLTLEGIAMPSSGDGWIIGNGWDWQQQTFNALLMHYTGGAWQTVASLPQTRLWSISMSDIKNGRIAGSNNLLLRMGTPDLAPALYLPIMLH